MTPRTWNENRELINGLWPRAEFTAEEADLWRADLSGLDQQCLLEAIRQVKRTRDSVYPQLAWLHEEYRTIRARNRPRAAAAAAPAAATSRPRLTIDPATERRVRIELEELAERATTDADLDAVVERVREEFPRLHGLTAARLLATVRAKRERPGAVPTDQLPAVPIAAAGGAEQNGSDLEERRAAALRALGGYASPVSLAANER